MKDFSSALPAITADTRFSDYVRWEGSFSENAEAFAEWAKELDRVGATIDSTHCHEYSAEINFTMTLRQAFDINWTWDCPGDPFVNIAESVLIYAGVSYKLSLVSSEADPQVHEVASQIESLWGSWCDEAETPAAGAVSAS